MDVVTEQVKLLNLFKTNILEFLDELIEQFEEEGDLLVLRFFLSEQVPIEMLMNQFLLYVYPHSELIKKRDEVFFLEKDNIFGMSPKDKVVHFKELYLKMSTEDRTTLWDWFSVFISICEKYITISK